MLEPACRHPCPDRPLDSSVPWFVSLELETPISRDAAGSAVSCPSCEPGTDERCGHDRPGPKRNTGTFALTGCRKRKRPAEASRFSLIRYRCRWFGRAAPWDACHPLREPGSAGQASDRRLAAGWASDPTLDSGPVDFGSSWFFLSWEHRTNGPQFRFVPDKEEMRLAVPHLCQPDIFRFAFSHWCPPSSATAARCTAIAPA